MRLFQRGHVLETVTRYGRSTGNQEGKNDRKSDLARFPSPEPQATRRPAGKHQAARDAAGGPNEGRILSGRSWSSVKAKSHPSPAKCFAKPNPM